ncbi:MAG: hypothetical protein LC624_10095, partial [Halobacteriales archaeon]|nr:hypothetical protein [Halobacteriales archaeon]
MQARPGPRLASLMLAGLLLAPLGLALPAVPGAPSLAELAARGDVAGILQRMAPPGSRAADVLGFAWSHSAHPAPAVLPEVPSAPLADAVADAYAAYALPAPSAAEREAMAAQEAGLDPAVARAASRLLESLLAHAPLARGAPGMPVLEGSALRIARAADALADALRGAPPAPARGAFLFQDPLGLVLVGDAGSNTYAGNHAGTVFILPSVNLLTIDLGGDDVYTDNAGGAYPLSMCMEYAKRTDPFGFEHTSYSVIPPDPGDPRLGLCGNGVAAAATIDLGGDDAYDASGSFARDAHLAAQGGGIAQGIGLLVDLAGDDRYASRMDDTGVAAQAVQGGGGMHGFTGFGFLLDLGQGRDAYLAEQGTVYDPVQFSQQRAQGAGEGILLDDGGDDTYTTLQHGPADSWQMAQANIGELLDLGGDDVYLAQQLGLTGSVQGVQGDDGLLLEMAGDDVYRAEQACGPGPCFWQNVQGSAEAGGSGELVDIGGDDAYIAISDGEQHNQASGVLAPTVLVDLAGDDLYYDVQTGAAQYAQAAGKGALSVLLDAQGIGLLVDLAGDDRYASRMDDTGVAAQAVQGGG